jgi:putative salt-induced outer membrane protein YdiY
MHGLGAMHITPAARVIQLLTAATVLTATPGFAQPQTAASCPCPPAGPPPVWTGSAGFGVTLNRGNTDTTNINLSFDATRDPKKKDVWKMEALYLRSDTNGELSANRVFAQVRYERNLTARLFAFGQLPYLRDHFKSIDYYIAPNGGIGYKLVTTPQATLTADAGFGVKWEKNPGFDLKTSAVVTSGDRFELKLSPTSTITQSFSAIWDANDWGDALYTLSAGVAAALTTRSQLKLELLDAYATRPPTADVKNNDVALLAAVVYKF